MLDVRAVVLTFQHYCHIHLVCVCVCSGPSWRLEPLAGLTLMAGQWVWQWKAWTILTAMCWRQLRHTFSCWWRRCVVCCYRGDSILTRLTSTAVSRLAINPSEVIFRWKWKAFGSVKLSAFLTTGYFLPLPQVTCVQRYSEEGPEPPDSQLQVSGYNSIPLQYTTHTNWLLFLTMRIF